LFPDLTVVDNLLVATHRRDQSGFLGNLFASPAAVAGERASRDRVWEMIDLLGIGDVAERRCAGLPFGVLRLVEVARALVTGAPFVMLDEPASGLDISETDRLV